MKKLILMVSMACAMVGVCGLVDAVNMDRVILHNETGTDIEVVISRGAMRENSGKIFIGSGATYDAPIDYFSRIILRPIEDGSSWVYPVNNWDPGVLSGSHTYEATIKWSWIGKFVLVDRKTDGK